MFQERPEDRFIGIVGIGTMGRGIVKACLARGFKLLASEMNSEMAEKSFQRISSDLKKRVDKGKLTKDEMDSMLSRIRFIENLDELSEAQIVIEAIDEEMSSKLELYGKIEPFLSDRAILASNTSSLSISELSQNLENKARFLGMHFFNPADIMPLVEIVKGDETSEETIATISSFAKQLGKTPIIVPDVPGFYVNRILFPMIIEGIRMQESTGGPAKEIDLAMKLGANLPMGPLELSDFIGNDIVLHICEVLWKRTGDQKFVPPELLRKMVADGKLGRKTGEGFHDYK